MPLWLLCFLMTGGAVAVSVFGLYLVRRLVSPEILRGHHDVAGFILAIVGVIYAVLIAFVVLVVWEQFEDAGVVAEHEANATLDVYRLAHGFGPQAEARLRKEVRAYARSVLEEEWPAMQNGGQADHTSAALDLLWLETMRLKPRDAREASLYGQTITRLTDIGDNRRLRLLASHDGLPLPMWFVLLAGGAATMIFTYFFGVESFRSQAAMTALLAATIALVLFIISALNYPFSGDLRIRPEAMTAISGRFDLITAHEGEVP